VFFHNGKSHVSGRWAGRDQKLCSALPAELTIQGVPCRAVLAKDHK
jgi:hypothetical protein